MQEHHNSITERLIRDAGIHTGLRVLDLGCGNGEVTKLLAEAVGSSGEVVGIDINADALALADEKLQKEGFTNYTFIQSDISSRDLKPGIFDAIVGRRVLMYLKDQAEVMRRLNGLLKSGGVIAFQESDATITSRKSSAMPVHERANHWLWRTVEAEGGKINTGFQLPSLLASSGFVVKNVRAEAIIQGQSLHYPLSAVVKAVLPRIVAKGVATADEVDIETLEQRLLEERSSHEVYISDLVFSVWALKQ